MFSPPADACRTRWISLHERTVGIVGVSNVSRRLARLGVKITTWHVRLAPTMGMRSFPSLNELVQHADIPTSNATL